MQMHAFGGIVHMEKSNRYLIKLQLHVMNTARLQWLEHRWLVYHGYFELVLESLGKNPIAADIIIFGII